jgi:hypothetical protein
MASVDFGYHGLAPSGLDQIALEQGGVLGTLRDESESRDRDNRLPEKGGWEAVWVGARGQRWMLVLKPTSPRTRSIMKKGLLSFWQSLGLSPKDSSTIYDLRCSFKHELIPNLVEVLDRPEELAAFRAFPVNGSSNEKDSWYRRWRKDIEYQWHPRKRRESLAMMVQAIVEAR